MQIEPPNEPEAGTDSVDSAGTLELRDRNVYILGAGFSKPAGAPLIHDFLDCSRRFLDAPFGVIGKSNSTQREPFETVFKYMNQMSRAHAKVNIDLLNIEELFGLVEISSRLDPQHMQKIRDSTVLMIARTLDWATRDITCRPKVRIGSFGDAALWSRQTGISPESFQVNKVPPAGDYLHMDVYTYFAALAAGLLDDPSRRRFRRDSVITFNYDLVLDYAFYQVGVTPDYHLQSGEEDPDWKPTSRTCPLFKLHGSINWGECSECGTQLRIGYRKPSDSPLWYPPQCCPYCRNREQFFQPLLVPPSWDKSGHRDVLAPVWAEALQEMKAAKRICVIGYSMPKSDAFFKYLMALALAENDRLSQLIVVDINPEVETRWEEFLDPKFAERRFEFNPQGLIGYVLNKKNLEALGRGEDLKDKTVRELMHPPAPPHWDSSP
jgi:NAD-dependent SIR2 family protein deacetylase